jgi:predicted DNA-binding protein
VPKLVKKSEKATLVIEMPKEMWEQLRWLSFNTKVSMSEICRKGIEKTLKENLKKFPTPPA